MVLSATTQRDAGAKIVLTRLRTSCGQLDANATGHDTVECRCLLTERNRNRHPREGIPAWCPLPKVTVKRDGTDGSRADDWVSWWAAWRRELRRALK